MVGETLVLDCEVSRSNAEVTWKKNGEEVEDSRKVTVLEDGVTRQLTIHSVTVEDAGQYVCDAKDDVMDFNVRVQGGFWFYHGSRIDEENVQFWSKEKMDSIL